MLPGRRGRGWAAGGCSGSPGAAAAVAEAVAVVAVVAPTVIGVACLRVVSAAVSHCAAAHHWHVGVPIVAAAVHLSWR